MNPIVSQDELAVLLMNDEAQRKAVVRYDFRRPDRITREQLRALQLLHERFAYNVAMSLSAFLRATTELAVVSVDQVAYGEFLATLPESTAFYAIAMPPLEGLAALEIDPPVAFAAVDRMLGGAGRAEAPSRPLTEIEQNVLDSVVKLFNGHLTETWEPVAGVQFTTQARDTRPQMLQVTGRNEVVVLLLFSVKVAETKGTLKLCLPATAIEALGERFLHVRHRTRPPSEDEAAHLAANLGRVPLAVNAQLSTVLSARELVSLQVGDVLSLGRASGQPVTVSIGDHPAFAGQLLVHNGSLAVRVASETGDADKETNDEHTPATTAVD